PPLATRRKGGGPRPAAATTALRSAAARAACDLIRPAPASPFPLATPGGLTYRIAPRGGRFGALSTACLVGNSPPYDRRGAEPGRRSGQHHRRLARGDRGEHPRRQIRPEDS